MDLKTIDWKANSIKIIDQTLLPGKLEYLYIRDLKTLWSAIKQLKVRGAPALGAAAALGVYLGIKDSKKRDFYSFSQELNRVISYLGSSRPTARNLFWALEKMAGAAAENSSRDIFEIKKILFSQAVKIIQEDRSTCRLIARHGAKLILEATGLPSVVWPDVERIIWEGRAINTTVVVVARADDRIPLNGEVLQVRRANVVGSQGHSGQGVFPNVISCISSGMDVSPMITKKISLDDVEPSLVKLQTDRDDVKITVTKFD